MREILFRGKRIDNGEWVLGGYAKCNNRHYILPDIDLIRGEWVFKNIEVLPETVSQYTGLTDKNGTKIFEGDRVISDYGTIGTVEWDNEECSFLVNIGDDYQMLTDSEYVVIGNIYDNDE